MKFENIVKAKQTFENVKASLGINDTELLNHGVDPIHYGNSISDWPVHCQLLACIEIAMSELIYSKSGDSLYGSNSQWFFDTTRAHAVLDYFTSQADVTDTDLGNELRLDYFNIQNKMMLLLVNEYLGKPYDETALRSWLESWQRDMIDMLCLAPA